ncbi:MAG: DUF2330 domain-containing protein [Candidatus Thermoplasmatota archaeon]|jgi:hypothetical protein|nr:DUF2330 domain-containing protein [Candidatus Thermoplasmatota archaeon]
MFVCPSLILIPYDVSGDGGFIPSNNFPVFEPGQNAIVCWNGTYERMYLSVNIHSKADTEGLHVVPFPSLPDVTLGNYTIFGNMTRVLNTLSDRTNYGDWSNDGGGTGSNSDIIIEFERKIGSHDITVINVVDHTDFKDQIMDLLIKLNIPLEMWPAGLDNIISGYCRRGITYFAIDRFPIKKDVGSTEPLVYEFRSDQLIFPLEISSILDGRSTVSVACITPWDLPIDLSLAVGQLSLRTEVKLDPYALWEIDQNIPDLFDGDVLVTYFSRTVDLNKLKGDMVIKRYEDASWMVAGDEFKELVVERGPGAGMTSLLFYSRSQKGSKYIHCVDAMTGGLVWSVTPFDGIEGVYVGRSLVIGDYDDEPGQDIVVLDITRSHDISRSTLFMTRLSPLDGSVEWQSCWHFPGTSNVYLREQQWCLDGPDGRSYLMVFDTKGTDLLVVDMADGEMVSRTYEDGPSIDYRLSYSIVRRLEGPYGDRVLINEVGKTISLWDPWMDRYIWRKVGDYRLIDLVMYRWDANTLILLNGSDLSLMDAETGMVVSTRSLSGISVHVHTVGEDLDHDGNEEVISIDYGVDPDHLFDTIIINRVDIGSGHTAWWREMHFNEHVYVSEIRDLNSDGIKDIVLLSANYPNYPYLPSQIVVLDGLNGKTVWYEGTKVKFHSFTDIDGNGLFEVLFQKDGMLTATEAVRNMTVFKVHTDNLGTLSTPPLVFDLDGNGVDDLVMNYEQRVIVIDLNAMKELMVIDSPGTNWRDVHPLKMENGASGLLLSSGVRYYSFLSPYSLQIGSERNQICIGEKVVLFCQVLKKGELIDDADIVWSSSVPGCKFSETSHPMTGIFSTTWEPPSGFVGSVTIMGSLMVDGKCVVHASTKIVVLDSTTLLPGQEGLTFEAWPLENNVHEGTNVVIFARIGNLSALGQIEVLFIDPDSDNAPIVMERISDILWAISVPVGSTLGRRYAVVRVMSEDRILWEGFIRYHVERRFFEATGSDLFHFQLSVDPQIVATGTAATIRIALYGLGSGHEVEIWGDDHGSGGDLTSVEWIATDVWECSYTAPLNPGPVIITVGVSVDGSSSIMRDVEVMVVYEKYIKYLESPLELKYRVEPGSSSVFRSLDIYITSTSNMTMNDRLNLMVLDQPMEWDIDHNDPKIGGTVHLVINRNTRPNGTIDLFVYDENGHGSLLHIELSSPGGLVDTETDVPHGHKDVFLGPYMITAIVIILLILALIVLKMVSYVKYGVRKNSGY